jgi:CHASE2 domain-containing sensor protein
MPDLMSAKLEGAVLTKDILFGMNVLTLAGFLVMGLSLTLHRTGNAGIPLSIGLMCAGTALVFYGLFSAGTSN